MDHTDKVFGHDDDSKKIANWYFKLKQNYFVDVKRDHFDALYGLNCKTGKELQNKWESAANHANGTVNQLGDKLYLLWKKNKADIYTLWWIPAAHMKA